MRSPSVEQDRRLVLDRRRYEACDRDREREGLALPLPGHEKRRSGRFDRRPDQELAACRAGADGFGQGEEVLGVGLVHSDPGGESLDVPHRAQRFAKRRQKALVAVEEVHRLEARFRGRSGAQGLEQPIPQEPRAGRRLRIVEDGDQAEGPPRVAQVADDLEVLSTALVDGQELVLPIRQGRREMGHPRAGRLVDVAQEGARGGYLGSSILEAEALERGDAEAPGDVPRRRGRIEAPVRVSPHDEALYLADRLGDRLVLEEGLLHEHLARREPVQLGAQGLRLSDRAFLGPRESSEFPGRYVEVGDA